MIEVATDCRSEEGVTAGLVDSIIVACRVLAKRDLSPPAVREALKDLIRDEDLFAVLCAAPASAPAIGGIAGYNRAVPAPSTPASQG